MSTKRKQMSSAEDVPEKPLSKNEKKRQKLDNQNSLVLQPDVNESIAQMDSQLLADYLSQQTSKFENQLSPIELGDKHISATSIRNTTSWDQPRTLNNLPEFLDHFCGSQRWHVTPTAKGAPHTIIVSGSGLRAADLARVVRKCQGKDSVVAKLFAKHIKRKDAGKFLQSTRIGVAVGTPVRLNDLMDDGTLSTEELQQIVVDASHVDLKKRGIMGMRETHIPLITWLNRKELKARYNSMSAGIGNEPLKRLS